MRKILATLLLAATLSLGLVTASAPADAHQGGQTVLVGPAGCQASIKITRNAFNYTKYQVTASPLNLSSVCTNPSIVVTVIHCGITWNQTTITALGSGAYNSGWLWGQCSNANSNAAAWVNAYNQNYVKWHH